MVNINFRVSISGKVKVWEMWSDLLTLCQLYFPFFQSLEWNCTGTGFVVMLPSFVGNFENEYLSQNIFK